MAKNLTHDVRPSVRCRPFIHVLLLLIGFRYLEMPIFRYKFVFEIGFSHLDINIFQ